MFRFVAAAFRPVRALCRSTSPAFIHSHAILPEGLLAIAAKRWSGGVPLIVTSHGSDVPGYNPDKFQLAHTILKPVWHLAVSSFDALTAPSHHQAELIQSNRPKQHVEVIPNGVQPTVFDSEPFQRDGSFLIVSRLVRRKNYHEFFKALRLIHQPVSVNIVGDGPARAELEEMARKMPQHSFSFHGWLSHGSAEWLQLYKRSSFFVFPSTNENFPMNLLEAQLAGLLVLASPISANREVLGEHCLFFDDLTAAGMFSSIKAALAAGDGRYDQLTASACRRVKQEFAWDNIGLRFIELATI